MSHPMDDLTERWLKDNDPYYRDTYKNKRKKLEYPYETDRMEKTRRRRIGELPFSSLWKRSLYKIADKGVDVKPYLDKFDG